MTTELKFETEICSRCGGSGKHSFCQSHLDMCFKCKGSGSVFTKRALVAVGWFKEQNQIPVETLKIGDRFYDVGDAKPITVNSEPTTIDLGKEYGPSFQGRFEVKFGGSKNVKGYSNYLLRYPQGFKVRKVLPVEQHNELLKQAIALQNSLTKAGKAKKK